jgi:hypothetical protein
MAQCQTENCIMSRDCYSPGKWNMPIHPARLAAEGYVRPKPNALDVELSNLQAKVNAWRRYAHAFKYEGMQDEDLDRAEFTAAEELLRALGETP